MSNQVREELELERAMLLPLRQASALQSFSLFWMPARFDPMPDAQREWLILFLQRFEQGLSSLKLEKLHFLHSRVLRKNEELQKTFHKKLHRYGPIPGPSRSLNQAAPVKLTPEVMKRFAFNRKNPSIEPFMTETAFRLKKDLAGDFTRIFMGYGGATLIFSGSSSEEMLPQTPAPPLQNVTIPKFLRKYSMLQTFTEDFDPAAPGRMPAWLRNHPSMRPLKEELGVNLEADRTSKRVDTFGRKSRELFGADLKGSAGYEGLAFVLPRLTTQDFLSRGEDEILKWFEVFDVYIRESPEDEGFVIASKHDLRPVFREALETMREDGYVYWEG
ncbi:hypothetical protein [Silvibacterium acidisoli]|uniref:hypothetical protein n=1 Tax=Acidobacteriaceae bacterium ZG23-2 TaxID=2883246 RepID=UPI00406C9BEF